MFEIKHSDESQVAVDVKGARRLRLRLVALNVNVVQPVIIIEEVKDDQSQKPED